MNDTQPKIRPKTEKQIIRHFTANQYRQMKKDGISLYCPKDEKLNPVIKGDSISFTNRLGYSDTKFLWICCDCGLIWFSREQATYCRNRKHKSKYTNKTAVMVNETISKQNFYGGMSRAYWDSVNRSEGRVKLSNYFDYSKL